MKAVKPFYFKQFTIEQDKCALKVNTDAVLLGALAGANEPVKILDIGAGTGVISLMLAQRFPDAFIHSVEIEPYAFFQAQTNFKNSPWSERMDVYHLAFQDFHLINHLKYDLIVSNPPYYSDHLQTSCNERNIALHSQALTFEELAYGVREALSDRGLFYVILPERQMKLLTHRFEELGMYPRSKVNVYDKPGAQTLRVIQSFSFGTMTTCIENEIIIRETNREYTTAYASLLQDFLLIF